MRAINELRPVLGLELTATPFAERGKTSLGFRNVVLDYPLARAMADGFVKEPAVVTRKNFDPKGMSAEEIERLKLEDGLRLHEQTKVYLETYAREVGERIVKPFLLVIARDTTHAAQLVELIRREDFFEGRYRDKVIQVDSSQTGTAEGDEIVARLLRVEHGDEPTEIVIHVNMLKEGWDVTNLYTIVPLRAANARVLVEQSIGRGLRLPYGKRTEVAAVDRLSIVAHDRFQEIVDEASRPDSPIRLQTLVLDEADLVKTPRTVVAPPTLVSKLGIEPKDHGTSIEVAGSGPVAFSTPAEQQVARVAYEVILKLSRKPEQVPSTSYLSLPEIQQQLVREVAELWLPPQGELEGIAPQPELATIVAKTTEIVQRGTIDIPRILVIPKGEVRAGFRPFELLLLGLRYQAPSEDLWVQYLRTGTSEVLTLGRGRGLEARLEDYVVSGLGRFRGRRSRGLHGVQDLRLHDRRSGVGLPRIPS